MDEQEALTRVKTGNFNGGYGFDLQILVDAVGVIGEMFKSGQISEVVRCKDCKHLFEDNGCPLRTWWTHLENDFCSYGERREDD